MAFLDETGLQYYTTKMKDYISQKINSAVGNITSFRFEIVTELPQTGEVGVIYLKALAEQESSNLYEEFIWVDDSYEFIGTNEIDLSGYYTKEETNKLVENSAYTLPAASAAELGGIKVGENLTITDGVLSAVNTTYSYATETDAGLMSADDKVKLNSLNNYELPSDIQVNSIVLTSSDGTAVSLTGDVLVQLLTLLPTQ